jgi:hypothetical protein
MKFLSRRGNRPVLSITALFLGRGDSGLLGAVFMLSDPLTLVKYLRSDNVKRNRERWVMSTASREYFAKI